MQCPTMDNSRHSRPSSRRRGVSQGCQCHEKKWRHTFFTLRRMGGSQPWSPRTPVLSCRHIHMAYEPFACRLTSICQHSNHHHKSNAQQCLSRPQIKQRKIDKKEIFIQEEIIKKERQQKALIFKRITIETTYDKRSLRRVKSITILPSKSYQTEH